jgi:signal peptide peptidase SppA
MTDDEQPGAPALNPARAGPVLMQLADRVLGRPLLLHPTKAEVILHVLQGRLPLDGSELAPLGPEASRFVGSSRDERGNYRTYRVQDGAALISIVGSLVNRGAWIGTSSGMVSYEGLAKQIGDAAADPKVHTILLDIDSPGGEATGMFTLAAKVREIAAQKPVIAVVNDMAASAAYGIASQATEVVVSPTSIVGSIGVVLTHLDRSGELAAKGIKPTLIYAGRHKVDGNPYGPLTDAVMGDLQAEVAKFYDQFVGLVAQGRGERLTEQNARATEARTFLGQDAVDRGLADRMASLDAVLASLHPATKAPAGGWQKKDRKMSETTTTTPAAGITQEAHQAAVNAARAEGEKTGAAAATARIGAILRSEAAKGKSSLAMTLAFDTGLSAAEAEKALAAAAPETPAPSATDPIGQRAAGLAEFGAAPPAVTPDARAKSGWAAAVQSANKAIGAAS